MTNQWQVTGSALAQDPRDHTIEKLQRTLGEIQTLFAEVATGGPAGTVQPAFAGDAVKIAIGKLSALAREIEQDPHVKLKGASVVLGWPPSLTIELEWNGEPTQVK